MELIGKGNFANVYSFEVSNKQYACKILKPCNDSYEDKENKKRFEREVNLLQQFNHPNIIKLVNYQLEDSQFSYTMERYLYNLEDYLENIDFFGFPSDDFHLIFSGIINAVKYSHSQGVVHRDLKPQNILINDPTDVVISDFGIAMSPKVENRLTTVIQGFDSGGFTAPEVKFNAKNADELSDIYSLGKILQYLISGNIEVESIGKLNINDFLKEIIEESSRFSPERRIKNIESFEIKYRLAVNEYLLIHKQDYLYLQISFLNNTYDEELMMEISTEMYQLTDNIRFHKLMMHFSEISLKSWIVEDDASFNYCLESFISYVESDEFYCSFDEVDKISETLKFMYDLDISTELKSSIIMCIANLAERYNRYKAMRICLSIISSWNSFSEIFIYTKKNCPSFQSTMTYIIKNESYFDKNSIDSIILDHLVQQEKIIE